MQEEFRISRGNQMSDGEVQRGAQEEKENPKNGEGCRREPRDLLSRRGEGRLPIPAEREKTNTEGIRRGIGLDIRILKVI